MKMLLRVLALLLFLPAISSSVAAVERPNLLLVVADDMGFSDLGSFGGEIETPNLDSLANQGMRLTNFHTAATCSPTRAMLLSGVDHHLAGLGSMAERMSPNQRGKPGYEGYLNDRVVSLATRLLDGGYRTYMAGKWHLGKTPEYSPAARGFERSFVLLEGGGNHYNETGLFPHTPVSHYREDNAEAKLPPDFYSSRVYTDKLLQYLREEAKSKKPFFAYLAYTAPHWPLQAPTSVIDKYRGRYDAGYDELRKRRISNLEHKGLLPRGLKQRLDNVPGYTPWETLSNEQRLKEARTMEIYAAMVDEMDRQFGRVLEYLKDSGELDNTIIIFMSDNGAEGADLSEYPGMAQWLPKNFDNSLENLGRANSYVYQGPGWATAVTAPFYQLKRSAAEGGIRTPAFVWTSNLKGKAKVSNALITVKDIAPTVLTLAGIDFSDDHYAGRKVQHITGKSFVSLLQGETDTIHSRNEVLAWELFGHRAVRRGPWKLVSLRQPYGDGSWQLFNLDDDPVEKHDLSAREPILVQRLLNDWETYATTNGVVLPE